LTAEISSQGKNILSNNNRPAQVADWFQHGWKWNAMPDIGAGVVESYSQNWWLWWVGLQPWRGSDWTSLARELPDGEIDWSATRKGGSNGFYVVLLALGWWFIGAKHSDGRGISDCEHALDDVAWVLEQMCHSFGSAKRSQGAGTTPQGSNKRYFAFLNFF
jgi:hypothetical protein